MHKDLLKLLNIQINREFYAAYLYLSMSSHFESKNLHGFAKWMRVQSKEEASHATKIYDFLLERGEEVTLTAIETPPKSWKTPIAAIEAALAHEKKVTAWIHELVDLSVKHKDHAATSFLKWYVDEQVEEENQTNDIVQKLKMAGDSSPALLFIDAELGKRE